MHIGDSKSDKQKGLWNLSNERAIPRVRREGVRREEGSPIRVLAVEEPICELMTSWST